jgi:hypothetical protein
MYISKGLVCCCVLDGSRDNSVPFSLFFLIVKDVWADILFFSSLFFDKESLQKHILFQNSSGIA